MICFFKFEFRLRLVTKMFKFLNQCFARLRFWKSVSSKTAVAPSSRFRESETLFQNRSCAKHWFKNLNILVVWFKLSFYRFIRQKSNLNVLYVQWNFGIKILWSDIYANILVNVLTVVIPAIQLSFPCIGWRNIARNNIQMSCSKKFWDPK